MVHQGDAEERSVATIASSGKGSRKNNDSYKTKTMIVRYIILGIMAALLLAGGIIPKDIKATREIVINKPVGEVFHYMKYLKNQ